MIGWEKRERERGVERGVERREGENKGGTIKRDTHRERGGGGEEDKEG